MLDFSFATANRIDFGVGRSDKLGDLTAGLGERPMVFTGGNPDRHRALIDQLSGPVQIHPITGEPTVADVEAALAVARGHRADVVIGIGGGSVIDAAKMVAILCVQAGDLMDYAEVIGRGQKLVDRSLPMIAVPTTAGTGSEVTANGVVASPEHGVKVSLRTAAMLPSIALVDPALTVACPPRVTASSGLDAFTQCLEPYVSAFATPLTDGFCLEGLRRAASGLRRAYSNGDDVDARADMSLCALLSGMSLANAKLGAVHGFAGPLGGMIDAPHGLICATLLTAASQVNVTALNERDPDNPALERYRIAAEQVTGERSTEALQGWIDETVRLLEVPRLREIGLSEDRFDEACEKAARASSMKGNPITLTHPELRTILERSY